MDRCWGPITGLILPADSHTAATRRLSSSPAVLGTFCVVRGLRVIGRGSLWGAWERGSQRIFFFWSADAINGQTTTTTDFHVLRAVPLVRWPRDCNHFLTGGKTLPKSEKLQYGYVAVMNVIKNKIKSGMISGVYSQSGEIHQLPRFDRNLNL